MSSDYTKADLERQMEAFTGKTAEERERVFNENVEFVVDAAELEAAERFLEELHGSPLIDMDPDEIYKAAKFRREAVEWTIDNMTTERAGFIQGFRACREKVASLFGPAPTAQLIADAIRALEPDA